MDLERDILNLYYRNKHNPEFRFIEGSLPEEGIVTKRWNNFSIGIEIEVLDNKKRYYLEFNNIVLALEVTYFEGYKEYSRYQIRREFKGKQTITRGTFKKYFDQFKQVIRVFELINESKGAE